MLTFLTCTVHLPPLCTIVLHVTFDPPAQKSEGDSVLGGQRSHVIIEREEERDLGTRLLCMLASECSIVILPQCGALRNVCGPE